MLKKIYDGLKCVSVMPIYIVSFEDYSKKKFQELCRLRSAFEGITSVIVRSSSIQEDTRTQSNAGKYVSVLDVSLNSDCDIMRAIEEVYASYDTDKLSEEILIQPMLKEVICSGVVFTEDMETFSDYYIINFHEGDDTKAVTSGSTNDTKTYVHYKYAQQNPADQDLADLLEQCREIERFLENAALDIEFAITQEHKVYILQVRPIAKGNKEIYQKLCLDDALYRIYKKAMKLNHPHPFLLGDSTCFGVMPDWNPAEILGMRPKKLAISLYKELITDQVWARQRKNYGYRNLTRHPLMVLFCGIPYIDTRITFNSFIPSNLNDKISEKLVNYYLNRLAEYPVYHDKIEFKIVFSCYYLGLSDKLKPLLGYGFNVNELKRIEFSLLELTNQIIHPSRGLYKKDIIKAEILEEKYDQIIKSGISLIDKIYWLIEICKEYGTLPFAGVARAGFIGIQFLDSFVEQGIITIHQKDLFMNSLSTITHNMNDDLGALCSGEQGQEQFLEKYGHIRPGTYDILSPRYDEAFLFYFGNRENKVPVGPEPQLELFYTQESVMMKINEELQENGLEITAQELITFIKEAIEGREYVKFIFTKLVSEILRLIGQLGQRFQISIDDLAYVDISLIRQLYTDLYVGNIRDIFLENIESNKQQYQYARQIKLPSIIVSPADVYGFYLLQEEPNYITQKRAVGQPLREPFGQTELAERIIFIRSADPGYDYLFSKNIGGLVTQFGGANSHMAIRCAELGIPAVIGCGEQNFEKWANARKIELDCQKKKVNCWS